MLSRWTRFLPYALVLWLIKKHCERVDVTGAYLAANPYPGEILSWKVTISPTKDRAGQ